MRFNTLLFALASSGSVLAQIPGISNSGDAVNAVAGGPAGTFNAIAIITQFYTGSLTPATFDALRAALRALPPTALTPSSVAIQNAFNAAKLATDQGSATVVDQMQQCFDSALQTGNSASCAQNVRNSFATIQTTFNTNLEQWVGILPNVVAEAIQKSVSDYLNSAVTFPGFASILRNVNNAISSVTASTTGNTVTAIQQLQVCFANSINNPSSTRSCVAGPQSNSPLTSVNSVLAGVLQQFVGVLPPNVVQDVQFIYAFYFSLPNGSPGLAMQRQVDAAIISATASVAGNAVTFVQQLQFCTAAVIMSPEPASFDCIRASKGPAFTAAIITYGILQPAFGYLPPNLVLGLNSAIAPLLVNGTPVTAQAGQEAMNTAFTLSAAGPSFVTCYIAVSECLLSVITAPAPNASSGPTICPDVTNKCPNIVRVQNA